MDLGQIPPVHEPICPHRASCRVQLGDSQPAFGEHVPSTFQSPLSPPSPHGSSVPPRLYPPSSFWPRSPYPKSQVSPPCMLDTTHQAPGPSMNSSLMYGWCSMTFY